MRQEEPAGSIHAIQKTLIRFIAGFETEADGAKWGRRGDFKPGIRFDQSLEELPQSDVLADHSLQPLNSVVSDNHPKFERSEPASELNAVIHIIHHAAVTLSSPQVVRHKAQ